MDGESSSKRLRDDAPDGTGSTEGTPASKKARGTAITLANTRYADDRKNLLKLVQRLTAAGAQEYLAVPRVVVIGNQSAGKSSVVEAISGITVPRDAGTCTRCPMECRMASFPGDWSCQISIRLEYDERSNKKLDKPDEDLFGGMITDKGQVELALRRAQFAVLNPEVSRDRILSMSHSELKTGASGALKGLDFSRNVVCIDIRGPDLTDLYFIDLPGLIQAHETETLVKLVENLVVDNIKEDNSLILVTIPMTDDLENQKALTLARQADVAGTRTIGVLTKADALPPGSRSRENWLEVIEGRKRKLSHGYFCTRQPDDEEREQGVDHPTARANETKFFETEQPWAKSTHRNQFGIQNLVRKIGPLLKRVIVDSLPRLQQETKELLDECELALARLPPAIDKDVVALMLELVAQLSSDMTEFVKGSQGNEELIQQCRQSYKRFKATIRATAPTFVPRLRDEKPQPPAPKPTTPRAAATAATPSTPKPAAAPAPASNFPSTSGAFSFDRPAASGGFSFGGAQPSTTPAKNPFGQNSTSPGTAFGNGSASGHAPSGSTGFAGFAAARQNSATAKAPAPAPAPASIQPATQSPTKQSQASTTIDGADDLGDDSDEEDMLEPARSAAADGKMYLDDMHDHIEKSLSRELPGDVPLSAKQALIVKYQTGWEKAALTCLDSVRERTQTMLNEVLRAHFGRWEFLHGHIRDALDSLVQHLCLNAWSFVVAILEAERTPATQNEHYFQTSQDFWLSRYRSQRGARPKTNLDPDKAQEVLAKLVEIGFHGLNVEDLQRLNPPDEYERELVVMAYVRGYYKVSFKRVIDIIPMLIDLKFLKELANKLQPHLLNALNVGGEDVRDRFERYFAEDEDIVARRKELMQRKETLEVVKAELYRFTL
ncbi:hypothetical protein PENSPDRAFT_622214 [Peniophora sp. CONT]|nr:hypothetical protein PENSPDRAFT_622214 [Peniophora sp. CONT]